MKVKPGYQDILSIIGCIPRKVSRLATLLHSTGFITFFEIFISGNFNKSAIQYLHFLMIHINNWISAAYQAVLNYVMLCYVTLR